MNTTATPPVILVPGHWLGGWAWDTVATRLTDLGHAVEAVTLPGTTSANEIGTTLTGQVDALDAVISRQTSSPVLVAHSGAGRVATGVLDRRPDSVNRVVYVDSGPAPDGSVFDETVPADVVSIPLPPWTDIEADGASLEGITERDLAIFRERAVPLPAGVARERLSLTNDARLDAPTTIIACSLPSEAMLEMAGAGHPMFAEVARLRTLDVLDLPTGHWPMWSRPDDLADTIAESAAR